jgi:hypothetical protein
LHLFENKATQKSLRFGAKIVLKYFEIVSVRAQREKVEFIIAGNWIQMAWNAKQIEQDPPAGPQLS